MSSFLDVFLPVSQVMSKRVSNARSELHYRRTGPMKKKKEEGLWQVCGVKRSA